VNCSQYREPAGAIAQSRAVNSQQVKQRQHWRYHNDDGRPYGDNRGAAPVVAKFNRLARMVARILDENAGFRSRTETTKERPKGTRFTSFLAFPARLQSRNQSPRKMTVSSELTDKFELEILATMSNYYGWIMDIFAPFVRGHVVEYGAGMGTISQQLVPLAERVTLVEPSPNLVEGLRAKFRDNPKIEVVAESLEQHVRGVDVPMSNTVVLVNVLEHIEDDRQALAALVRILRPGGYLLVFVPALQGLMSKLDLKFGHFRRYQRTDLVEKVAEAGGETQLCHYLDFIGILPWFVLNKVMGATAFHPRLISIHDKLVVPVSRTVERVIPPPIGKNIILVARKN
jgi:SAM-dependent methyltransferase